VPKVFTRGAQYLLIKKSPNTFTFGTALAHIPITLEKEFPTELIDLFSFKTGRTFETFQPPPSKSKDDWTNMIWDIIDIVKDKNSKRANIGKSSFPRLREYHSPLEGKFSSLLSSLSNGEGNDTPDDKSSDDLVCPSVILVE
jgi:hypothetical protein